MSETPVAAVSRTCADHTPCPKGYMPWHVWAERMAKKRHQVRCNQCGLWAIWLPKRLANKINAQDRREEAKVVPVLVEYLSRDPQAAREGEGGKAQ